MRMWIVWSLFTTKHDWTTLLKFLLRVNMASDWLWKMKCGWKYILGLTHKKLSSAILYPPSFLSTSCIQRIQQKNLRPEKGLHLVKGSWVPESPHGRLSTQPQYVICHELEISSDHAYFVRFCDIYKALILPWLNQRC